MRSYAINERIENQGKTGKIPGGEFVVIQLWEATFAPG